MAIGSAWLGASVVSVVFWGVSVPIAAQVAGSAGFFVLVTTRRLARVGVGQSTVGGSFADVDGPDPTTDHEHPILAACPYQRSAKVYFDYVAGALLIVLLSPLFIAIMACVRTDGGPMLFAQTRIGRDGRTFSCFKFRTMVVDADTRLRELLQNRNPAAAMEWEQTQKLTVDPRVTAIGALLRQTSLDELPQLFNVLRGEMSLVGPRPIVAAEVPRYAGDIAAYYAVRPRPHRPLAGERAQPHVLRPARGVGRHVCAELVVAAGLRNPVQDHSGGAVSARRGLGRRSPVMNYMRPQEPPQWSPPQTEQAPFYWLVHLLSFLCAAVGRSWPRAPCLACHSRSLTP